MLLVRRTITAMEDNPIGRDAPPTMPSRTAFLLSFLSVLVAGLFGGIIGYGLVDISSDGSSSSERILGALLGAVIAAGGIGIVAVLVLRAMAEWRRGKTR